MLNSEPNERDIFAQHFLSLQQGLKPIKVTILGDNIFYGYAIK